MRIETFSHLSSLIKYEIWFLYRYLGQIGTHEANGDSCSSLIAAFFVVEIFD